VEKDRWQEKSDGFHGQQDKEKGSGWMDAGEFIEGLWKFVENFGGSLG
jgi:hypothetical protein